MKFPKKFSELSETTQKYILDTARDLPFGRFLATTSPSMCRKILEPDVALGRSYTLNMQIFCEKVCELCKIVPWASGYLLSGQSPRLWPHIDIRFNDEEETAERLYNYIWLFLEHDHGWCPDSDSNWEHTICDEKYKLEFAVSRVSQEGLFVFKTKKDITVLAESVMFAMIVGVMQDMEGWSIFRWDSYQNEVSFCARFPLSIPQKPSLPDGYEEKTIGEIKSIHGDYELYMHNFYAPWRESIKQEMKKVLSEKGLGFLFE